MILNRKNIFKQFNWLKNKKIKFIISADYDGLVCASFLSHHLKWQLEGYYNMETIWVSKSAIENKNNLVWVDLNILSKLGKAIGGHITLLNSDIPKGLETSCNPNVIKKLTNTDFNKKFPFSTLIFLLWLFNYKVPKNDIAKFLILHSDSTWMKCQNYNKNVKNWIGSLPDYQWDNLFRNIDTIDFEKSIDTNFYPLLISIGAYSGFSKLKSKHLNIQSREFKFNPDWDDDIILNLFDLFAKYLSWKPPELPNIISKIKGKKFNANLLDIEKTGLQNFIIQNKIFSYAFTSPKTLKYTNFKTIK